MAFRTFTRLIVSVSGTLSTRICKLSIESKIGKSLIGAVPLTEPLSSALIMNIFVCPPSKTVLYSTKAS